MTGGKRLVLRLSKEMLNWDVEFAGGLGRGTEQKPDGGGRRPASDD
jgi:hypothetical protein